MYWGILPEMIGLIDGVSQKKKMKKVCQDWFYFSSFFSWIGSVVLKRPYLYIYEKNDEVSELGVINLLNVHIDSNPEMEQMLNVRSDGLPFDLLLYSHLLQ